MNRESSRSHSVFTLSIRAEREGEGGLRSVRHCAFNLVDLAGSERQKDTGSSGVRLKEACNINKSTSAGVIKTPPALPEDGAPSASLDHRKAQAAPTLPRSGAA